MSKPRCQALVVWNRGKRADLKFGFAVTPKEDDKMSKVKTRPQSANKFFYTLTKAQLNFGAAGLVFVLMAAWTFLVPGPVAANPLFQRQTQLRCGDCHQLGRELDGRDGLNPFGLAFLQNNYKIPSQPPPPTTQYPSQPPPFFGPTPSQPTPSQPPPFAAP